MSRIRMASYAVGTVEHSRSDFFRRVIILVDSGGPGVQLGATNAHQTTGHVQPERMIVVFDDPMNHITRQSVLVCHRGHAAIFQAAEPALSGYPKPTVPVESKVVDAPFAQPVRGRVGRADLTILEIGNATVMKSKPQASLRLVGDDGASVVFMSQLR